MKNKYLSYSKYLSNINYLSLLLFVFWLPLKDDFLPAILALWIFTWLCEGKFRTRFQQFPEKRYYTGFLIYFLLTVFLVYKAEDLNYGIFQVQVKLSLVFFPVILIGSNSIVKKNETTILKVFVLSNLIVSIYYLANAFFNSLVLENGSYLFIHAAEPYYKDYSFFELLKFRNSYFTYTYLSVFKHPSYSSMYIIFSIIIIIDFLRKGNIKKSQGKIAAIILILFFAIMLILLQSRAAIISFGIVIVIIPLIELKKKFKRRFLLLNIGVFLIAAVIILTNNRIRKNIDESITLLKNAKKENLTNVDLRFRLWYTSIKVIEENFWIGTSPANLTKELKTKYEENGFQKAAHDELNAHNQYLESFAGLGIIGFLSIIYIITYTFVISVRQRHYLLFFIMIILSINFLFESMLNRMAGVLFMMFFVCLFVFNTPSMKKLSQ